MSSKITDHPFIPSRREDSCDWTDLNAVPWTVCDYPQSQHERVAAKTSGCGAAVERDELRAEVEAWRERDAREHGELVRLRAEVERLQRENGALARMYALAEEKLRERTEAMNDAQSEVTSREWQLSEANKEIERLHALEMAARAYCAVPIDDVDAGVLYRALCETLRRPDRDE